VTQLVAPRPGLNVVSGVPPPVSRAKQFILENQAEDLSLGQVAKAVNTSVFYFCKMFKKATGLTSRELEVIQRDLHCNAVRITGRDLKRVTASAEDALKQGLEVWYSLYSGINPLRRRWPIQLKLRPWPKNYSTNIQTK